MNKKKSLAQSDALLRRSIAARVRPAEVLPPRLADGEHKIIPVADFKLIDIDDRYQRPRIGPEVNDIITAIRQGGGIGQDIHLARRTYEGDGKLWVVDGQQRWWACYDTSFPFPAKIHVVSDLEDERLLFRVLNTQLAIGANVFVNAHSGEVADRIRKANANQEHPLFGRVALNDRSGGPRIGAGVLVKGVLALLTGSTHARKASRCVATCDQAIRDEPHAKDQVSGFLWLIGSIFPSGACPALPVLAFGVVAREHWSHGNLRGLPQQPTPRQLASLRKVNWSNVAPTHARKWFPVVRAEIEQKWKR